MNFNANLSIRRHSLSNEINNSTAHVIEPNVTAYQKVMSGYNNDDAFSNVMNHCDADVNVNTTLE